MTRLALALLLISGPAFADQGTVRNSVFTQELADQCAALGPLGCRTLIVPNHKPKQEKTR